MNRNTEQLELESRVKILEAEVEALREMITEIMVYHQSKYGFHSTQSDNRFWNEHLVMVQARGSSEITNALLTARIKEDG